MHAICAISTAYGVGGIAVIRVSGEGSIAIVDGLFRGRVSLADAKGGTVHFGRIERNGEVLDEVLCSVFRAPHSFTGEDTVEIACHGSLYIQQELLRWLIDAGCKAAEPGEFTRRAFLNGKMDLTQAEAVADLIAAQSKAEKDLALSQLRGSVSTELAALRERLLHITSLVELELDFADHEELEFADRTELQTLADEIEQKLAALMHSFRTGNAIRNGISVAIIGAPNVGKSTLLNALLGEQRAIVSDIQGTTRDTIEDTLVIDGILFRLIDTAGIRETNDVIERMGVERSRQAMEKAQIIISVQDATRPGEVIPATCPRPARDLTVLSVLNKVDLCSVSEQSERSVLWQRSGLIPLSAKNGDIEPLRRELVRVAKEMLPTSAVMLSNARHYEAITRAHEAILRVRQGLQDGLSGELLSMDLQDCLAALGEVTGQITNTEVLALNSKSMDLSTRLIPALRAHELDIRTIITSRLERGKVDLAICEQNSLLTGEGQSGASPINWAAAKTYAQQYGEQFGEPVPAEVMAAILRFPDVTKAVEDDSEMTDEEWKDIQSLLNRAIDAFIAFRTQEGAALQAMFTEKLDGIADLLAQVEPFEKGRVAKIKERLEANLAQLSAETQAQTDRNRLEQEMIYYLEKLDITEEKVRLTNHIKYFRETMGGEGAGVGKKLGFIAQEMGREINTLGSKSNQSEMQIIVVKMKDVLEQIKEQVLNVL